jgi:Mrp family chromosome partitioning ATPase
MPGKSRYELGVPKGIGIRTGLPAQPTPSPSPTGGAKWRAELAAAKTAAKALEQQYKNTQLEMSKHHNKDKYLKQLKILFAKRVKAKQRITILNNNKYN